MVFLQHHANISWVISILFIYESFVFMSVTPDNDGSDVNISLVAMIVSFWSLPSLRKRPAACMNLSFVILGPNDMAATTSPFIFKSAPLVLASSKMTKVSWSGIDIPLLIQCFASISYTFHLPFSSQNEMPANFFGKSLCYASQGTIYFSNDFPTHNAPASMIQPTFSFKAVLMNLCHWLSALYSINVILTVNSVISRIIFPSVPLIAGVSHCLYVNLSLYNHLLSFVPEKPTLFLTFARSHAEAEIDCVYCLRLEGNMHLLSQNEIVRRFLLNVTNK